MYGVQSKAGLQISGDYCILHAYFSD